MLGWSERRSGRGAFTLVELLVVVIIVGVLAASAVPIYMGRTRHARMAEAVRALGGIRNQEIVNYSEHQAYVAVKAGSIAHDPVDKDGKHGLGLDLSNNAYFAGNCFSVALDKDYRFVAKCDGSAGGPPNDAPRASAVSEYVAEMRGTGQMRLGYDGGKTWTAWE